MFRDEAHIAARLSHPNIISIHGLGHDGQQHFLAMEVLLGRSLLEICGAADARRACACRTRSSPGSARASPTRCTTPTSSATTTGRRSTSSIATSTRPTSSSRTTACRSSSTSGWPRRATACLDGHRRGQGQARLPGARASARSARRPARRRVRARRDAVGGHARQAALPRGQRRRDRASGARSQGARPDDRSPSDYPPALAAAVMRALARDPAKRWQTAGELRDALDAFVRDAGAGVDADSVRALLAHCLAAPEQPRAWESLVEEAAVGPERIRVWDDDRQKMTWMNAAVEAADSPDTTVQTPRRRRAARRDLPRACRARARRAHLGHRPERGPGGARPGPPRAGDRRRGGGRRSQAAQHARASLEASPTGAAHAMLRRLEHARGAAASLLAHLDAELAACASEPARIGLLAERARLVEACSKKPTEPRAAWERVLSVAPQDPAALRGLEGVLAGMPGAVDALAIASRSAWRTPTWPSHASRPGSTWSARRCSIGSSPSPTPRRPRWYVLSSSTPGSVRSARPVRPMPSPTETPAGSSSFCHARPSSRTSSRDVRGSSWKRPALRVIASRTASAPLRCSSVPRSTRRPARRFTGARSTIWSRCTSRQVAGQRHCGAVTRACRCCRTLARALTSCSGSRPCRSHWATAAGRSPPCRPPCNSSPPTRRSPRSWIACSSSTR